ncbi:MAG: PAS domain S-box protein [Betaproteobacteria bacterium]|nr:PAS domain S-box protein [Betaproteobacteria bacterium]
MTAKKTPFGFRDASEVQRLITAHDEQAPRELRPGESPASLAAEDLARKALLSVLEDQQHANESLRTIKARMDSVLDSIDEVIWSVDAQSHRMLYLNRAIEVIYGRPVQAFFDSPQLWLDAVVPEDLALAQAMEVQAREHGRAQAEYRIVRPDGEVRWVRNSATLVRDETGQAVRLDGVISDITASKRAVQALAESEQQFRSMVEQSIAGMFIVQDGRIAYVNPRCAEILGYDAPDDLIGRDPLSLVPESDRERLATLYAQALAGVAPSTYFTTPALKKDGSTIAIGAHGTAATYRGRPAIINLAQDITEKKRADAQIERFTVQLQSAFMRSVEIAMNLSEMRDPYTAGHERRVAEIAVAIGAELGLDAYRLEGLRVAGYLHDVGKISIPSELLSKPTRLTPVEFALVKGHAEAGYEVLRNVEFPWPVAQVALQHHERIDGSGYPQGLKGDAILLEARIMAVADVVEAMSSHRPYRAGLGIEKALAEIERGRGTAYDADVANACLTLFRERNFSIPD